MKPVNKSYAAEIIGRLLLIVSVIIIPGCSKLVEVNPPNTSSNANNVYTNNETAAAVLTGIYTNLSLSSFADGGVTSMSLFPALSSDELAMIDGSTKAQYVAYYTNSLTSTNTSGSDFWNKIYPIIYYANSAIEGLNGSLTLTAEVKKQLLGEAKFIRAFCYFYLVNLYGDVPIAVSTDLKTNEMLSRRPVSEVYAQIIADLLEAQSYLVDTYVASDAVTPTTERTRPNKSVATALLARVYLYLGEWAKAEEQASAVINQTASFSLVDDLNAVFLKNSSEAIWQLQPVLSDYNTQEARIFVLPPTGPSITPLFPFYLSAFLISEFESGDLRETSWTDSVVVNGNVYYYPFKYKVAVSGAPVTEYTMVIRLSELYLIRAEARAELDNLQGAKEDINVIRTRAGLSNVTASDKQSVLNAIMHERQVELFTEWGHRWFDLKRTGNIDAVMGTTGGVCAAKGGVWNGNWQWYPISLTELQRAPNLVQNAGY